MYEIGKAIISHVGQTSWEINKIGYGASRFGRDLSKKKT